MKGLSLACLGVGGVCGVLSAVVHFFMQQGLLQTSARGWGGAATLLLLMAIALHTAPKGK